jgi:hypothetical protein
MAGAAGVVVLALAPGAPAAPLSAPVLAPVLAPAPLLPEAAALAALVDDPVVGDPVVVEDPVVVDDPVVVPSGLGASRWRPQRPKMPLMPRLLCAYGQREAAYLLAAGPGTLV